jgi:hypothetical protein
VEFILVTITSSVAKSKDRTSLDVALSRIAKHSEAFQIGARKARQRRSAALILSTAQPSPIYEGPQPFICMLLSSLLKCFRCYIALIK